MQLQVISDLHLEFEPWLPQNCGSDVLVLAGDIVVLGDVALVRQGVASQRQLERAQRYQQLLGYCSREWEQVYLVLGNHEHYGGVWQHAKQNAQWLLEPYENITLLDDSAHHYGDHLFLGTTLWTSANNEDPISQHLIERALADYKHIYIEDLVGSLQRLRVEDTLQAHHNSVAWLRETLEQHPKTPTVVITHHAPSFHSVAQEYKHEHHLNGGFASDLSNLILDNPQIQLWAHGHMHNSSDYQIGSTRVVCNPKGYHRENPHFNPNQIYLL